MKNQTDKDTTRPLATTNITTQRNAKMWPDSHASPYEILSTWNPKTPDRVIKKIREKSVCATHGGYTIEPLAFRHRSGAGMAEVRVGSNRKFPTPNTKHDEEEVIPLASSHPLNGGRPYTRRPLLSEATPRHDQWGNSCSKRFQLSQKPTDDLESEDDTQTSPTVAATKRKKAPPSHLPSRKPHSKGDPRPPSPPQLTAFNSTDVFKAPQGTPLPPAFELPPPEPSNPGVTQPVANQVEEDNDPDDEIVDSDINDAITGFREEWEADPTAVWTDMALTIAAEPAAAMNVDTTAQPHTRKEWSLILSSSDRPDLEHHSDNPYDFLPAAKLDKLIHFWMGNKEAEASLSKIEKEFLGQTKVKKILAKVVLIGDTPVEYGRKVKWIRSAILSALAQRGADVQRFSKMRIAINMPKPGYSWVVIPVGIALFKALEGIRGAMDPRSGTLVLFRPWKDESFPIQHIYAIGIHRHGDRVPFEVATADYVEQMTAPLAVHNARILDTTPANHGVAGEYATKIKFGFNEGTIPFLINPKKLTRQFRTGLGNSKTERNVQYRWPPKCRHCESEKHLTPVCPWRELEIDNRKPNFHNKTYEWQNYLS